VSRARLIVVAALWLLITLPLGLTGAEPEVIALAGVLLAGSAVIVFAFDLSGELIPVPWTRRSRLPPRSPGSNWRSVTLRRQMTSGERAGSTELRTQLVSLVDDRLAAHHRVDRAQSPSQADAVLTPALRRLVAEPRSSALGLRELRRIVADIEAL
jgi:hypothetical protein